MSQFLPEQPQAQHQQDVVFSSGSDTTAGDVAMMQRAFAAAARNPNLIPPDFMAYLIDYVQTSRLSIPIGQVFGFQAFVSTQVTLTKSTGTNSASHTFAGLDPAWSTAGPSVVLGPAGQYVILAGVDVSADSGVLATSFVVSGGGPTVSGGAPQAISVASFASLSESSDDVTLTSTFNAGPNLAGTPRTASFANATIIAIRYAN